MEMHHEICARITTLKFFGMLKFRVSCKTAVLLRSPPIGEIDAVRLCTRRMEHISGLDGFRVPKYQRDDIQPGVLNFGLRNFHRVHNAVFFDDVLHIPGNKDWGIVSVGISDSHKHAYNNLKEQDSLYSVVSKNPSGSSDIRVIGSILETLQCPSDTEQVITFLTDPSIKLVLLTMKENNYHFDRHFSGLNLFDPKIQGDLVNCDRLNTTHCTPRSPVGILTEGLYRRFKHTPSSPKITILCCDNIIRGGEVTRGMIHLFASQIYHDSPFLSWLSEAVHYPNAMCDRICHTDAYPDYASLQQTFGVRDDALLTTEDFREWVIEGAHLVDNMPIGFGDIPGIRIVDNAIPYEQLKLRVNYGTRLAVACVSSAIGYSRFEDALEDPIIRKFANCLITELICPNERMYSGLVDLSQYKENLIKRISTKQLRYLLDRVVEDTSTKLKMNWQPVLEADVGDVPCLGTTVAIWAYMLSGHGDIRVPIDANLNVLEPLARALVTRPSEDTVRPFTEAVFHTNSFRNKRINNAILGALKTMEFVGIRGALQAI